MIYVLCPAYVKTGGTELLHQLVGELKAQGKNADIVYTEIDAQHPGIHPAFLEYTDHFLREEEILDKEENILVFPEIYCEKIEQYHHLKIYIWWLSVDNYRVHNSFADRKEANGFWRACAALLRGKIRDKTALVKRADLHLCQSYYAADYVTSLGIPKEQTAYLSDYVNDAYLSVDSTEEEREDVVLYNPKKGAAFTAALRECAPEFHWVPLIGMSTQEVRRRMRTGKVYIDFGNHPGKDRIPREAAVSGCIVITGKRGSAGFAEDVRIPERYKFDEKQAEKQEIVTLIADCMAHYEEHEKEFADYRTYIRGERKQFRCDVRRIFG